VKGFVGRLLMTCVLLGATVTELAGAEPQHNWPQWRGPLGTGVAPGGRPPITWSETKHICWKTALPGKGHSTPIVWGERIFLTTAIPYGQPVKPRLPNRLGAHDMHTKHGHGEGSSPALHGETLIVNWDHEEQSFLLALDKRSGKPRWRVARAEDTSWATPIVVEHAGKAQAIVPGTNRLRGYDLASGAVLWECGGLSSNIVASPATCTLHRSGPPAESTSPAATASRRS
jgi:PQQ-like domain